MPSTSLKNQALNHLHNNNFSTAKLLLKKLLEFKPTDAGALLLLAKICFKEGNISKTEHFLKLLANNNRKNLSYQIEYANFLLAQNRHIEASNRFSKLNTPEGYFNRGYYLQQGGKPKAALTFFNLALKKNITNSEEVWLKIGNCYRDMRNDDKAEKAYKNAIRLAPEFMAAYYNLANLYEDRGIKKSAKQHFRKIKPNTPLYPRAISRLSYIDHDIDFVSQLIGLLELDLTKSDRCDLLYALAHCYQREEKYSKAWGIFQTANRLNSDLLPSFTPQDYENKITELQKLPKIPPLDFDLNLQPIFICGMFRSGSTLLEQILSMYPEISAGGELEIIPRLALDHQKDLHTVKKNYLTTLKDFGLNTQIVTDKHCDNIWHIDLIKQLFPHAKIVITHRNLLDNTVSIFTQRLGVMMPYASTPEKIAYYYACIEALTTHWKNKYDDVFVIDYENLVNTPQTQLVPLLKSLNLKWSENCLNFHQSKNTVKTASVWQVRNPLYKNSIGRWKHYKNIEAPTLQAYKNAKTVLNKIMHQ